MSPVIVTLEELLSIKPAWWEEGGLGLQLSSRVLTWLPQFNPGYFQNNNNNTSNNSNNNDKEETSDKTLPRFSQILRL